MKQRQLVTAAAAGLAVLAGLPATAAPPTPAPTDSARFYTATTLENIQRCDPRPTPMFDEPAIETAWTEARRGHDATFRMSGTPVPLMDGCAQGLWTSAPLRVTRQGKVGNVAVQWSGIQPMPHDRGNEQVISVRFTDTRGRWGPWLIIYNQPLTEPLDIGAVKNVALPIRYRGAVPAMNLRIQVKIEDRLLVLSTHLKQTVHITA